MSRLLNLGKNEFGNDVSSDEPPAGVGVKEKGGAPLQFRFWPEWVETKRPRSYNSAAWSKHKTTEVVLNFWNTQPPL